MLKVMGKSKNKGLNRATQNTGYMARFTEFLTYKAELPINKFNVIL
jgi:putative transposase